MSTTSQFHGEACRVKPTSPVDQTQPGPQGHRATLFVESKNTPADALPVCSSVIG
ncbi:MAG: hypothetical protein AB1489_20955 [Acidobacteriota bacterium]